MINQTQYELKIKEYEKLIEINPDIKSNYWNLGLLLLLQGREQEAQITWMNAILDISSEQLDFCTKELLDILSEEAEYQESLKEEDNLQLAWLIREHIQQIDSTDLKNALYLIQIRISLNFFQSDNLVNLINTLNHLSDIDKSNIDEDLIFHTWKNILNYSVPDKITLEFVSVCLEHIQNKALAMDILLIYASNFAGEYKRIDLAIDLLNICLKIDKNRLDIQCYLASCYQDAGQFQEGISYAQQAFTRSLINCLGPSFILFRGLVSSGVRWSESLNMLLKQERLLNDLIQIGDISLSSYDVKQVLPSLVYFPYFRDEAKRNRELTNKSSNICQLNIKKYSSDLSKYCENKLRIRHLSNHISNLTRKLKIGYISNCFMKHSVGWLARSLFQHRDHDRFELYTYFTRYLKVSDSVQKFYEQKTDYAYTSNDYATLVRQICDDEIDILVDLDSLTNPLICEVLALKPAPIQVTWLGWDASGIPAVDYFIADPYVLPNEAEEYYSERVWRLPNTFIAVDGFEVEVPTLHRSDLGISEKSVVYLTVQGGQKRHPQMIRNQMQIIKNVPDSYLLIKGFGDQNAAKGFFLQIASEEGISANQLRFLPMTPSEAMHRANISIADVVLDTYPYSGATTTLETLWMGVPLITRVGQQFSARNSYTMMMNVGVTEGIAWTDEEYIEWGIRLGKDESLRQQISWKLRQSRHTSPLWNGEQFTRDMESAYQQMWKIYQQSRVN